MKKKMVVVRTLASAPVAGSEAAQVMVARLPQVDAAVLAGVAGGRTSMVAA